MNNEKKGRGSFIAILVLVLVLGISIGMLHYQLH